MSITPHKCQMGTNHPGEATLDTLVIPVNGAADVDIATVDGTIRRRLLSCTYATNQWTLTFRPNTLQPLMSIDCDLEIGTSTYVEAQVAAVNLTNQTITINFELAAGTATPPPAGATLAKLHMVFFRLNPT